MDIKRVAEITFERAFLSLNNLIPDGTIFWGKTSQFPNLEFIFNSTVNINKLIILTTFPFIQSLSDLAMGDTWETACYATCTIVILSLAELSNHLCENVYVWQMYENVNVVHACEREKRVHTCTFVHSTLTKTIRPFRFIRYKNEIHVLWVWSHPEKKK